MVKVFMSFWMGASERGARQGEKSEFVEEHLDLIGRVFVE
jgi:hypothetical protein